MNAIVAQMLGENGEAEERKEVALAHQIVAAAEAKQNEEVIRLARLLIKMHLHQPARKGLGLQLGTITTADFLSGAPFRLNPKTVREVPGMKPLN